MHAEEIKAELTNATMLLDEENSVLPLLKEVIAGVTKVKITFRVAMHGLKDYKAVILI